MVGLLFLAAVFSPIWKGGAISYTLDFAKVWIVWILTFLAVTNFERLRRILYIQSGAVAVISVVSIVLGHGKSRLEGVIGGIYSNPNDLAFAIVLTLPFCLAFLLTAKRVLAKLCWSGAILVMGLTLFMTASRAGFIALVISGTVCMWHFGVKGRRFYLIAVSVLGVIILLVVAGGPMVKRMAAIGGNVGSREQTQAYESYEERRYLNNKAIEGIKQYPVLGLGARNFETYSGVWKDVHMTYLQVAVEGGIPCLIFYLLFLASGFRNLRVLRRTRNLDVQMTLFVGGLHGSLIGFVIGALFAPVAYQFFPYFTVAYTSALIAMIRERPPSKEGPLVQKTWRTRHEFAGIAKR
jgi:O-antigen ligase